jgi:hypothetical protein
MVFSRGCCGEWTGVDDVQDVKLWRFVEEQRERMENV